MAQLAIAGSGAAVGAAIGTVIAPGAGTVLGAQLGFAAGSILGGILFPAESEVPAPSIPETRVSSAAIGKPVPLVYGTLRIAGNYIWAGPVLRKKKKETIGKGGGTEVTETKLFQSFAVSLAAGPIAGVTRIWADNKLIFDISEDNLGPAVHGALVDSINQFAAGTLSASQGFQLPVKDFGRIRVYLGGEDQLPDPLIASDARIGEATGSPAEDPADVAPPHRGLAYIVFERFPLEVVNNHLPQLEAEVVTAALDAFPGLNIRPGLEAGTFVWGLDLNTIYSFRDKKIYSVSNATYNFDAPKTVPLARTDLGFTIPHNGPFVQSNNIYSATGLPAFVHQHDLTTGAHNWTSDVPVHNAIGAFAIEYPDSALPSVVLYGSSFSRLAIYNVLQGELSASQDLSTTLGFGMSWVTWPRAVGGSIWAGLQRIGGTPAGEGARLVELDPFTGTLRNHYPVQTDSPSADDALYSAFEMAYDPLTNSLLLLQGDSLRRFNLNSRSIDGEVRSPPGTFFSDNTQAMKMGPFEGKFWLQYTVGNSYILVDTVAMQTVRTIADAASLWTGIDLENENPLFDPKNNALVTGTFFFAVDPENSVLFLDRMGKATVQLNEIVDDISDRVSIGAGERDTAALSGITVCGYPVGQRIAGRKALEPLAAAYNFDVRDSDFKADFFLHGGAAVRAVPEDDLGALASRDGSGQAPDLEETRASELELPERLDVAYVNLQLDHNGDTQHAKRVRDAVDSRDLRTVQLPIVFDGPDEPKRIAERILYQAWARRTKLAIPLPWQHIDLDVGDVITTSREGVGYRVMIEQLALGDDLVLEARGVSENSQTSLSSASGSVGAGFQGQRIRGQVTSEFFLFDGPLLRDRDEGLVLYSAAAPALPGRWPGAAILRSDDGGASFTKQISVFAEDEDAQWGVADSALGDGPATVFDRVNSLDISLFNGTLSSAIKVDVLNGANALLLGREILQFQTATPLGGNKMRLSGLLRGRRGTDIQTAGHAAGERVLLLSPDWLARRPIDSGELGKARLYSAVTVGSLSAAGPTKSLTYAGASLKPYAPVHIEGARNGDLTWTITWVRRTRLGGQWVDFIDAPLGEASEAYEVDVLDAPGGTALVTKTGLTSETVTLTTADIQAAYGAPIDVTAVHAVVYQMSATVGRGFGRAATIASATAFLPSSIAALDRWYDASDPATLSSTGSDVDQWSDRSGNNNHLTAFGTRRPGNTRTINGLRAVDFDGVEDSMINGNGEAFNGNDRTMTFALVLQPDSFPGAGTEQVISIAHLSDADPFIVLSMKDTDAYRFAGSDNTRSLGIVEQSASVANPTSPHVWIVRKHATTVDMFIDGERVLNNSPLDLGGLVSHTDFTVGAFDGFGPPLQFYDGLIGEILVYTSSLSDSDLNLISSYLHQKWGLPQGSPVDL